jgi:hypothetical protein
MTEQVENNSEIIPENKPVERTETELRALDQGWVPKEEFDGDEDSFVDAKEFLKRGELFSKIDSQNRELKAVKKALSAFKEHYTKVEETAYKKALADLKKTQKEALVSGDTERFYEIEEQIEDIQTKAQDIREAKGALEIAEHDTQPVHPQFQSWVNRNQWYESSPYMRKFADDYGLNLAQQGLSPDVVLRRTEEAVKKEFPNKFVNPNKERAGNVEGSSNRSTPSRGAKGDDFQLDEQERNVMNTLVKGGHITKEQYIADLKKAKGLN